MRARRQHVVRRERGPRPMNTAADFGNYDPSPPVGAESAYDSEGTSISGSHDSHRNSMRTGTVRNRGENLRQQFSNPRTSAHCTTCYAKIYIHERLYPFGAPSCHVQLLGRCSICYYPTCEDCMILHPRAPEGICPRHNQQFTPGEWQFCYANGQKSD